MTIPLAERSDDLRDSDTVSQAGITIAASPRDLRLDFFRGLALFCIFLDHIPDNWMNQFTIQAFGFSDAAEVFILISGYTAGTVYGNAFERKGMLRATVQVYHRVWQLYIAHVFLFMIFMATVAHMVGSLENSIYAEEFGVAGFLEEPDVAVVMALILRFQPTFMDILPLYIVLLAGLPFMLAGFRRWPIVVLCASFGLWLAVQFDDRIALSAYPGPDQQWFFNPFAWQFLFYFGAWLGWRSTIEGGLGWLRTPGLFPVAMMIAAVGLLIQIDWRIHWYYDPFPELFAKTLWPLDGKTDLAVLRLVNVLALAAVTARLIHPQARFLSGMAIRPFILCGRNSLHIFCLGILLSVVGHLVLNEYFGGRLMQSLIATAGVAIMIGVAALMEWFAKESGSTRSSVQKTAMGGRG